MLLLLLVLLKDDFLQLIERRAAQAEIINVVLHIFPDVFYLINNILVEYNGTAPFLSHCKCDVLPFITNTPLLGTTFYISLQYKMRDTLRCLVSSPSRFDNLLHSSLTRAFTTRNARHYKGY
jgi:membrane-bound metal-dependent hydrolase YbcI (DUF457 family)